MGQQTRNESLFYCFRLKEQIPDDHLLRLIDRYIDLSFVRERLKRFYSWTGRPSIDPEVLLRLLLVGYLYGFHQISGWAGHSVGASAEPRCDVAAELFKPSPAGRCGR